MNTKSTSLTLCPLSLASITAGFPSPADDYLEEHLDLNDYCIQHPHATFMVRVRGLSMLEAGIFEGDILVVDRSLQPCSGQVVIAAINNEFTVKNLEQRAPNEWWLVPANRHHTAIKLSCDLDYVIWGVVTTVIRRFI
jgi:DNA polymerase V